MNLPYFRPARISVVLLTLYALMVVNWQEGALRFTSPRLNVLSLSAALLIPLICSVLLVAAPGRNAWRIGAAVGLGLLSVPSVLLSLTCLQFGQHEIATDQDSDMQLLQTVPVDGPPTRIYREMVMLSTDDVIIRQERTILPGLIWITSLHYEAHACDVTVQVLDAHRFRCAFAPDGELSEEQRRRGPTITLTAR